MFERFTEGARSVVKGSVEKARRTRSSAGEAELLLALLDCEGTRGSFALAALGLLPERRESLRRALDDTRRRAGLSRADTEALASLGIDLPAVVAGVEDAHGKGALAERTAPRGGFGTPRLTREAKDVLHRSLRIATAHRDRHLGDEHILLALTARPGAVSEALADHGVTHGGVRRVLYGRGGGSGGGQGGVRWAGRQGWGRWFSGAPSWSGRAAR